MTPYYNQLVTLLFPYYRKAISPVRGNRSTARVLFGIEVFANNCKRHWDWTTVCLRKAIRSELTSSCSLLDMGCGPEAILSIYAYRRGCRRITAVDIIPEVVECARHVLRLNKVKASVYETNLGEKLPEDKFDIICFNSPYIPESWGMSQNLSLESSIESKCSKLIWSGGTDGTQIIERFLQEMPHHLSWNGKLLLGFNRFYLDPGKVESIVAAKGLKLVKIVTVFSNPAVVFVIQR